MMKHTLNERCVERAWVLGRDHRVPKFLGLHERSMGGLLKPLCITPKNNQDDDTAKELSRPGFEPGNPC